MNKSSFWLLTVGMWLVTLFMSCNDVKRMELRANHADSVIFAEGDGRYL